MKPTAHALDIARVFRAESGKIRASLIGLLDDFEEADDVMAEAFERALAKDRGAENLAAYIQTIAKRCAIDRLRKRRTRQNKASALEGHTVQTRAKEDQETLLGDEVFGRDERLRLLFTCCHPALAMEARVALTLNTLGGLTVSEVARAFLVKDTTMAQRLVRAKRKIKAAKIPYAVPEKKDLSARLQGVLDVLYLIFNEGYASTDDESLVRSELCSEAITLAQMLEALLDEPECTGLLALMQFHHARRAARTSSGELLLLEAQDRSLYDRAAIEEAERKLEAAMRRGPAGPFQIQAAIAGLHARAPNFAATDWPQIAGLYGVLAQLSANPVVEVNRAVAIAMCKGPEAGLALLERLSPAAREASEDTPQGQSPAAREASEDTPQRLSEQLANYHLFFAVRADLEARRGEIAAADEDYARAIELVSSPVERRLLERKRAALCSRGVSSPASRAAGLKVVT